MKAISLSHLYGSIEIAVSKIIFIEYDPALIIIPVSSLLNVSDGYCFLHLRYGIHTLTDSFHIRRCQPE